MIINDPSIPEKIAKILQAIFNVLKIEFKIALENIEEGVSDKGQYITIKREKKAVEIVLKRTILKLLDSIKESLEPEALTKFRTLKGLKPKEREKLKKLISELEPGKEREKLTKLFSELESEERRLEERFMLNGTLTLSPEDIPFLTEILNTKTPIEPIKEG